MTKYVDWVKALAEYQASMAASLDWSIIAQVNENWNIQWQSVPDYGATVPGPIVNGGATYTTTDVPKVFNVAPPKDCECDTNADMHPSDVRTFFGLPAEQKVPWPPPGLIIVDDGWKTYDGAFFGDGHLASALGYLKLHPLDAKKPLVKWRVMVVESHDYLADEYSGQGSGGLFGLLAWNIAADTKIRLWYGPYMFFGQVMDACEFLASKGVLEFKEIFGAA